MGNERLIYFKYIFIFFVQTIGTGTESATGV